MPPAYAGPSNLAVPDPDSVQKTRSNEEPGGPADVAAVVADRPERLGREIRHGGTDATGGSNRSDIQVFSGGCAIPVEIRKDYDRRLWRAVGDQLGAGYASGTASSGFGILVVLWFGRGDTPVPPSGRRPKTAGELCARLGEGLTGFRRQGFRVIVIDVSATGG